jgi:hypothetical protein
MSWAVDDDGMAHLPAGGTIGTWKVTAIVRMVCDLPGAGIADVVIPNGHGSMAGGDRVMQVGGSKCIDEIVGDLACYGRVDLVKVRRDGLVASSGQANEIMTNVPGDITFELVGSCVDRVEFAPLSQEKAYQVTLPVFRLSLVVDDRRALASLPGRRVPGCFSKEVGAGDRHSRRLAPSRPRRREIRG